MQKYAKYLIHEITNSSIKIIAIFAMALSFNLSFASAPPGFSGNAPALPPVQSLTAPVSSSAAPAADIKTPYEIEQEKEDETRVATFKKMVNKDFHTYVFPKEYYKNGFSNFNASLPPVIFYSYIAYEAFKTAADGNLPALRYFLNNYDFSLIQDNQGRSILTHTVMTGNLDSVRVILMKKITKIAAPDNYGKTALHYAVAGGDYDMTRLLLTMGAPTNSRDKTGLKPIDYLMSSSASDNMSDANIRKLILEYEH
jgi:ankyrin repeat protein